MIRGEISGRRPEGARARINQKGAHLFPQRLARGRQAYGIETEGAGHGGAIVSARPNGVKPREWIPLEVDSAVENDRSVLAIAHP